MPSQLRPGNVIGPASATDGHLALFDGTDGKKLKDGGAVPSGGGGGLTEWDSGTEYAAAAIVLDRNGIWKATGTNTNSRPVSGNANWKLVGGEPYVDLMLDPVALTTAPFYDPNALTTDGGPGLPTGIGAPGEGLYVFPTATFSLVSAGDDWENAAGAICFWGTAAGGVAMPEITDGSNGGYSIGVQSSGLAGGSTQYSQFPGNPNPFNNYDPAAFLNLPLVIATQTNMKSGPGTRFLSYRIHYKILAFSVPVTQFWSLNQLDQGSKLFCVNGNASAISGSMAVVGSTGNDGDYTIISSLYTDQPQTIIAVNQGTKTFTVAGDQTGRFPTPLTMVLIVAGSTGNDGSYGFGSATLNGGDTDIVVGEAIPNATADGMITGPNVTEITVSEAIPDPTADGWVKQ